MSIRDVAVRDEDSALWTLEEISRLVSASGNASETLNNIVHLIQRRFGTDVCSVYLLEPDRANLVLAATVGLRAESVGRVGMRLSEGLAGLVAERLRPQFVADAPTHPRFKYFPEAGEDPYRSFLGVPIVERGLLQGVLVVQTIDARTFGAEDMRLLTMAGAQLAPMVTEARTLGQFVAPAHQRLGALAQNLVELGSRRPASFASSIQSSGARSTTIPWPCCSKSRSTSSRNGPRSWRCTAASTTPIAAFRSICTRPTPGAPGTRGSSGRDRSRSSPRSSASTNRCRSIRAASASWPAITSRAPRTSAFRSSASAYYDQGYFRQRLDRDGWQHEDYIDVDHRSLPMRRRSARVSR